MIRFVTAAILLLSFVSATFADYEKGRKAYKMGDYSTAVKEWQQAADQGDADAQYSLGFMYRKGQGIPQDYAEAVKWFRKAADQRNARAQLILGAMYDDGRGVPQDYAEAAKWYRKAADQGVAKAQLSLGVMYGIGKGVPKDYVMAHMWTNLAGSTLVGDKRKKAIKARDALEKLMTPKQIAEAQRLAREWRPKR